MRWFIMRLHRTTDSFIMWFCICTINTSCFQGIIFFGVRTPVLQYISLKYKYITFINIQPKEYNGYVFPTET